MFQNNLLMAAAAGGGVEFEVTQTDELPYETVSYTRSKTWSSVDLGSNSSGDKHVILAFHWGSDARPVESVTIAGVTATILLDKGGSGETQRTSIAIAETTATSGDIVLTQQTGGYGSFSSWYVAVFQMLAGNATPTDSFTSSAATPTGTIDIAADGFCVGVVTSNTSATFSWTGLTEEYDRGANVAVSLAFNTEMSEETGRTVTADPSGGPTQRALCVASFEEAS